jgi:hypothetical protein
VNPLRELEQAVALAFAADPGWWWMLALLPLAIMVVVILIQNFWDNK